MDENARRKVLEHLLEASDKEISIEKVTPEMSLRNDLEINSLSAVELVMDLEDEFDLEVSDEELMKLETVNDLYDLIDRKKSEKTG